MEQHPGAGSSSYRYRDESPRGDRSGAHSYSASDTSAEVRARQQRAAQQRACQRQHLQHQSAQPHQQRSAQQHSAQQHRQRPVQQHTAQTRQQHYPRATQQRPTQHYRTASEQRSNGNSPMNAAEYTRQNYLKHNSARARHFPFINVGMIVAILVIVAAVSGGAYAFTIRSVPMIIDGQGVQVQVGTSLQALAEQYSTAAPGRLLAVDGSVIDERGGIIATATVDGSVVDDLSTEASENSDITFGAGRDVTEDFTEAEEPIPATTLTEDDASGAIHTIVGNQTDGMGLVHTGVVSGKKVTQQVITEPESRTYTKYDLEPNNGRKMVALTFDDGPWDHTSEVLDVLRDNGAKATFFTVGDRLESTAGGVDLVKREHDEGHQVCTHSFDHASGRGNSVDLGLMSGQEQRDEITKGQQVITQATGVEASKVFRAPGGNFSLDVVSNVQDLFTYEIGWNVDTTDWKRPGAPAISERILSVDPGDVVLMHDGGGDRSQTVEALRVALPKLKEQGYEFVTIDELLADSTPESA